jgi:hypothetical protein
MVDMTEQQLNALIQSEDTAWCRVEAYIIVKPIDVANPKIQYGKIKVAYPVSGEGILQVWVWDTEGFAGYGKAKGGGYDKLNAALSEIVYDGERMVHELHKASNEWDINLRRRGYEVIQAV